LHKPGKEHFGRDGGSRENQRDDEKKGEEQFPEFRKKKDFVQENLHGTRASECGD
jgi:hypothetical protein